LSFDDTSVDAWVSTLPLLAQYHARVTFFVSRYRELSDAQHAELHQLAAAGHDVEAHSVQHLRAPVYVEERGLAAYLADEAQPSIDALVGEGFDVTTYAYPFGDRTSELDRALLARVQLLRSVAFTYPIDSGGCPR
jgi:peptidoglycan/xylan/chitin deacetylase (PgdA/CDA1 family)